MAVPEKTEPVSGTSERTITRVLLLLYFLTRLPWIFMVPMREAPDEFSHFWVIQFLLEHGRLPEAAEIFQGGPSAVYGSLPQLGYLPHVLTAAIGKVIAPGVDISVTSRFGSMLIGVVLLLCARYFGKKLFGFDRLLALALPLLVIFHPQMVLVHTYANCDSTMTSLAAVAFVLVAMMLEGGLATKRSLSLGLLLGWLVLTKYPSLAVLPACAAGYVAAAAINKQSPLVFFAQSLLTAASMALACAWWFVRSASLFHGDFMGTNTMFHTWAVTYNKDLAPDIKLSHILKDKAWWRKSIFSYWGMFGYMTVYLWRPLYITYIVLMCTALGGGIKSLIQTVSPLNHNRFALYKAMSEAERKIWQVRAAIYGVFTVCLTSNLAAMVYGSTKNLGSSQGRYLFPSELPILSLITGGLYLTQAKVRKPLIIFFVVFNAITYVAALCQLAPMYGFRFLKTY